LLPSQVVHNGPYLYFLWIDSWVRIAAPTVSVSVLAPFSSGII
jgi:hypothetical protein